MLVSDSIIANKYKLIKKIGNGNFGSIYKGINIRTNENVAVKIELISDELKLLRHESNIYRLLSHVDGVPKIKWYGKDELYYYMVIDLFGDSLQESLNKSKKFKLKLVLQLGINILDILMKIHNAGFIHRDIKPENFLFSLNKPVKIYIIDFGISKPYILNNNHIPYQYKNKFVGNLNFASINTHNLYEQSRRDDLESLAYMLVYFYFGELEWINYYDNNDNTENSNVLAFNNFESDNQYIKNQKESLHNNSSIPKVLLDYYVMVKNLEFEETPDYAKYINEFRNELCII
jgi:serine/threonine protein kinase